LEFFCGSFDFFFVIFECANPIGQIRKMIYFLLILALLVVVRKVYQFIVVKSIDSNGKIILVTGAASGIGKATVELLLEKGCRVYATDISLEALKSAHPSNDNFIPLAMDVTNTKSVDSVAIQIEKDGHGKLFGVVNSAGIAYSRTQSCVKSVGEADVDDELLPIVLVNVIGTMRVNSRIIRLLKENEAQNPCIVNIASLAGRYAMSWMASYASSKFAVVGYSDTLRKEIYPSIRVTCIEPSFVETPMVTNALHKDIDSEKTLFYKQIIDTYPKYMKLIDEAPKLVAKEVAVAISNQLFSSVCTSHVFLSKNPADSFMLYLSWILPTDLMDRVEFALAHYFGSGAEIKENNK
jgi:NAD(P)-dependent dehydrogenase (short-subunit alcohol dehydrogenase family)